MKRFNRVFCISFF